MTATRMSVALEGPVEDMETPTLVFQVALVVAMAAMAAAVLKVREQLHANLAFLEAPYTPAVAAARSPRAVKVAEQMAQAIAAGAL